ncbi:MAG: DUF2523 domain-containing protein [Methylophilus methylotrophus]|uniref:DUF2523 domain-containing protein n=1 Tax=Methylophilus methylotrophus TaxID=17 RepID=A0A5C7WJ63_METME|nr:MAG: DUF2523 domain-containing protein [Methylophilus methylotrophus]
MTWAAWILALVAPIAKKVMVSLGIGILTVTGFDMAMDSLTGLINQSIGGSTADILGIATMMGIPDAIGIMLGGITSGATLVAVKRFNIL